MVLLFKTLFTSSGSLRFLMFLVLLSSFDITTSISSLTSSQSSKAAVREEAKALLVWKATLHNQTASLIPSWTNSSSTACSWSGISCNKFGRVIEISLTSLGLSELAYTMRATEKSDVYTFGVLSLEVIMGRHPGDIISSLSSSSQVTKTTLLMDLLDARLPSPTGQILMEVVNIVKMAFACLHISPECRPTMSDVARDLSTPGMSTPLPLKMITLGQLRNEVV